jgi:hypothetical protein
MRFLIDANMPRSIIALVASLGHEVEFARDVGLAAAPDHVLRDATFVGNLARRLAIVEQDRVRFRPALA